MPYDLILLAQDNFLSLGPSFRTHHRLEDVYQSLNAAFDGHHPSNIDSKCGVRP